VNKPLVEIVIPVYNEQAVLEKSVTRLREYLRENFPYSWRITIADNASLDRTWEIAQNLQTGYPEVKALHLEQKGRGRALRQAWLESEAEIVSYMDVDLSTGLESFWPLIEAILKGEREVATGSRLAAGAVVRRQWKREFTSRVYNRLIKLFFFQQFSDAQCGFKACRAATARQLLPLVEDNAWFFDTELLLLAEHNGLPIFEVPVNWVEDLDSRVKIARTALEDLGGLWRVRRTFWRGRGRLAGSGASGGIPCKVSSES
jgi:glycosyltransferase involved in cell wall biosynthesis